MWPQERRECAWVRGGEGGGVAMVAGSVRAGKAFFLDARDAEQSCFWEGSFGLVFFVGVGVRRWRRAWSGGGDGGEGTVVAWGILVCRCLILVMEA